MPPGIKPSTPPVEPAEDNAESRGPIFAETEKAGEGSLNTGAFSGLSDEPRRLFWRPRLCAVLLPRRPPGRRARVRADDGGRHRRAASLQERRHGRGITDALSSFCCPETGETGKGFLAKEKKGFGGFGGFVFGGDSAPAGLQRRDAENNRADGPAYAGFPGGGAAFGAPLSNRWNRRTSTAAATTERTASAANCA